MTGTSILDKIRSHLVDDAKHCLTWASVHYAIVLGAITTWFSEPSNWSTVASAFYEISPEYRWFVPPVLGFTVAFIPIALRIWKQGKTNA